MDRTFSKRRYLITTLVAAGAAATFPACSSPELPPSVDTVKIAEKAPPPISGGTLLVTSKGTAVAADSDRDTVWVVDLASRAINSVELQEDDEPGRVIEDGAGRIHVALRRAGAIATIDLEKGKVIDRTPVCPAPRGMAYDAKADVVHVACAGGELVSLPAAGGAPVRSLRLDKDLRDIVIQGDELLVSRFRSAELLRISSTGTILTRQVPPSFTFGFNGGPEFDTGLPNFSPSGAWRMVPLAGGGVAMAHQRSLTTPVIITQPDGYGNTGGGCDGGIVHPTVTAFDSNGSPKALPSPVLPQSVLVVDMAVSSNGNDIAMVAAGSDKVIRTSFSSLDQEASTSSGCSSLHQDITVPGEPVAVAFWNDNTVVQTREGAAIYILDQNGKGVPLVLPAKSVADTGHNLFHRAASDSSAIACASCHLEGHDDGHTWMFDSIGPRRTQMLGGDVLQTAPFHWDGDMKDLGMIMDVVFVNRMGGQHQGPRHVNAISNWMGKIPALPVSPPAVEESAIQHGADLFVKTGCQNCHTGAMFTNNTNQDVGTGKAFQVPSLVGVANRAPYMHDGCAATLRDRFINPCAGGDKHGTVSNLSSEDIDDLVAYLETL